jgi:hypothetical protein
MPLLPIGASLSPADHAYPAPRSHHAIKCNAEVNPLRPLWGRLLSRMPFKNGHFRPPSRFALDQGNKVAGGFPRTTSFDAGQDARRVGVAT